MDPNILAALISASVTATIFVIGLITKPLWETYFHIFKLKADHQYDQRKKIKEAISKYKVRLLDSAESLNHRFWNFSENCPKGWHSWNVGERLERMYYLQSFTFRFLAFFAWCRKIENEMVYLDSTVSDKDDLEFIKYLKIFPQLFCDTELFHGFDYDNYYATDHFFKDDFIITVESMFTESSILNFLEFQENEENIFKFEKVYSYIGAISNDQACLKWYSIHLFHFILMAFLTKFGYDFQKTSEKKLTTLANKTPKNILLNNLDVLLRRNHLENCKEIKSIINVLNSV